MIKNIALLWILFFVNILFSQRQQFSKIIDTYHSEHQFNGSVLVASNGEVDFIKSIGMANREYNIPIHDTSKFRIASITKTFTAVLIMKLIEENKLDLNTTIGTILPNFKGEGKKTITVHNLLTYASGLENKLDKFGMEPYQVKLSLDDFIDKYCSNQLKFELQPIFHLPLTGTLSDHPPASMVASVLLTRVNTTNKRLH